ncbi:MAG: putative component of type VI protein secretion system [Woeseiaceae bacterium]|jgi:predicted component of type VI protein secretion system
MARLILSLDSQVLAEYNMSKERYTIGRLPDNDVRIDNPAVSGHHSLIINILNDSFLEDLNSTNGTYVNGKLIKKHALQHGDVITIGHHQLRFSDQQTNEAEQDEFEKTMVIPAGQQNAEQLAAAEKAAEAAAVAEAKAPPQVNERVDVKVDMPAEKAAPAAAEEKVPEREMVPEARPAPAPAPAREPAAHTETSAGVDLRNAPNALPLAKLQVLSGAFAGRELELTKALTTLGRPGVQVAAITRRAEGYYVVHVESGEEGDYPLVNGQPIGAQARKLTDNDVLQLAGVKMGFFSS